MTESLAQSQNQTGASGSQGDRLPSAIHRQQVRLNKESQLLQYAVASHPGEVVADILDKRDYDIWHDGQEMKAELAAIEPFTVEAA
jgi:hypothetical protein